MSEIHEATKEFLIESHENLDQLDIDLVDLEKSSEPRDALARIFRTLHTIKGSCSFLGFPHLESLAHAGENLLGRLRDGETALTQVVTSALLRMVDGIRRTLAEIEQTGKDAGTDHLELIRMLEELSSRQAVGGATTLVASPPSLVSEPESSAPTDSSAVYDSSVRIGVELLDKLMAVAGEIVLARNQILQFGARLSDPSFQNACRQLSLITSELQEHVMKTRLQPVGNVFGRLPRLVRDAALACGKQVRLETEGSETELDKSMIEAIRDPLTHLVRNAVDHGIEAPEGRRAAGKPTEGCIRLRAYHEGGQVKIEISDDGRGIDPLRVKRRALEQRLIGPEYADRMSDQSLVGLIFLPGFTTADRITTVSGRGVGMDVVKSNLEKIGGSVDVDSFIGRGTTVKIRIPLTLAIIKVIVVNCADQRFAIPQVSIIELIRLEAERASKAIQRVHGVVVYRYRDRLLPLVHLDKVLQLELPEPDPDGAVNLVVLQAAGRQFGLIVDAITDTQEIVVKPLWKHLKALACFAGATVMGDGRVSLILDPVGVAHRAGISSAPHDWGIPEAAVTTPAADRPNMLVVRGLDEGRLAIPLRSVARLEEFPRGRIEQVGGRPVVQYRGQILPLIELDHLLGTRTAGTTELRETLQVVVCGREEHPFGLVVDRILDIVPLEGEIRGDATRPCVDHTAVIQGHITEVLNVEALLAGNPLQGVGR